MPEREPIGKLVCIAVLTLAMTTLCAASSSTRPNVIVVLTDDQGYGDFGVHGNPHVRTPHLDRFATEGVRLTRFYSSPVCAPTRASLMTGRYYYRSGVIHTSRGAAKMAGDNVTVAEMLKEAGYATGIFGKWHLGDNYPMRPQDQGFDEVLVHKSGGIGQSPDKGNKYMDPLLWHNGKGFDAKGYCTDVFTTAALRFIEENQERSFFVYLPTNTPHTPLQVEARYSQPYLDRGLDEATAKIYGMITNIDDNFGRLLAKLEALGLREKTLVVFFGDNGANSERFNAGLRGRKATVYEGGIRSPCFVDWRGVIPGGRSLDVLAAHIDLAPTLLEACGATVPAGHPFHGHPFDGRSFLEALRGKPLREAGRNLFFQCHRGLTPQRYQHCAVVSGRFKLVGYPGTFQAEDLAPSVKEPVLELYDLAVDPGEEKNIVGEEPDVAARLRRDYDAWFDSVHASRGFTPGRIHVGSDAENPLRLCWYQDASRVGKISFGWPVVVVHAGRYELVVEEAYVPDEGQLSVSWRGSEIQPIERLSRSSVVVELPAEEGLLNVWFGEAGLATTALSSQSTIGNVRIRRL
jgi:arylsulfatase A-like enzyme